MSEVAITLTWGDVVFLAALWPILFRVHVLAGRAGEIVFDRLFPAKAR